MTTVAQEDIATKAVKLSEIEIKDENQTLRPLTRLEREHLKHSISKFGVKVPVDINDKYEVVDGHHRTEIPDKSLQDWAQSPVESEHYINPLTVQNQIVLDPFMGSGTFGIAALNLKRQFIGIEIDQKRFEVAKANLERASQSEKEVSA